MEDNGTTNRFKLNVMAVIFILCWSITLYLFYRTMIGVVSFLTLFAISSLFGTTKLLIIGHVFCLIHLRNLNKYKNKHG